MFITFEGPEGAGKTTVLEAIVQRLTADGIDVLSTREPGGIRISEKIRSIILDNEHQEMDSKTEALLYAAARRQHLVEKIQPALAVGKIVLCDRFIDSSLAYQGFARGLGINEVMSINAFAIDRQMPNLTIYFDLEPEIGLQRIAQNDHREENRLDNESIKFHEKVCEGYRLLREQFSDRIVSIDASLPIEQVIENVWKIVRSRVI